MGLTATHIPRGQILEKLLFFVVIVCLCAVKGVGSYGDPWKDPQLFFVLQGVKGCARNLRLVRLTEFLSVGTTNGTALCVSCHQPRDFTR